MGQFQAKMWIWDSIHHVYNWSKPRSASRTMVGAIVLRWRSECTNSKNMAVTRILSPIVQTDGITTANAKGSSSRTHNGRSSDSFSSTNGSSGKWPAPLSTWASLVYILEPGDGKWEFVMGTKPAVVDPFDEYMADCNFFNWDFRHIIRPLFHFGKWNDADRVSFRKE